MGCVISDQSVKICTYFLIPQNIMLKPYQIHGCICQRHKSIYSLNFKAVYMRDWELKSVDQMPCFDKEHFTEKQPHSFLHIVTCCSELQHCDQIALSEATCSL